MATFSPQVKYTCTSFYYVRPLPPLERALHLCLHYGGPAGPEALAAATRTPLSAVYRAIVELLRHGLITLADTSHSIARPARRQARRPRMPDAPISDERSVYVATTARHIRPLTLLEAEILRYCQTPISLHALSVRARRSPATIVWLIHSLMQHVL